MKPWEIFESVRTIGYLKTYELLAKEKKQAEQPDAGAEPTWQEIVERNKREKSEDPPC